MDVTIDHRALKAALTIGNRAAAKRGALPALSGVRLETEEDGLFLAASDLDVTVLQHIPGVVRSPGIAVVPAKLLLDTVRKGKGDIALVNNDGDANISVVNGTTTQLRTLPSEEFLRLPGLPPTTEVFPLDLDTLSEVIVAASKDDARPILAGVLFSGDTTVATDSYRLHLVRADVSYPTALVPSRGLAQVLAAKPKGPVGIQFGTADVRITAGTTSWVIRLTEGEFPNYHQLIPTSNPYEVELDRAGFISLVAAIAPMAREASPVRLHFGAAKLTVTAVTHDVGEATGSMDSHSRYHLPEDGLTVAFNPGFLLDAAKAGQGDKLVISFIDALKPALISDERGAAVSTRLLMPVRVS